MARSGSTYEAELQRLKYMIDTVMIDKDALIIEVQGSGKYDKKDTDVWKDALRYAHERLRPVLDELNILYARINDIAFFTQTGIASVGQGDDDARIQNMIDDANVPMLEEPWLEYASVDQMKERLAVLIHGRVGRAATRKTFEGSLERLLHAQRERLVPSHLQGPSAGAALSAGAAGEGDAKESSPMVEE